MTWAKLDDRYDDGTKIKRAWRRSRAAVGLHVMAITYCARNETDGLLPIEWVEEKVPTAKERTEALRVLVDLALFEEVDGEHFRVHDYLDFNPSRDELADRRRREADRKATARNGRTRTPSTRSPRGHNTDTEQTPGGHPAESARSPRTSPARVDPARPVPVQPPQPPTGGRRRDQDRYAENLDTFRAEHPCTTSTRWERVRSDLRQAVGDSTFRIWLDGLHPHESPDGTLLLGAPAEKLTWIRDGYAGFLQNLVTTYFGPDHDVQLLACEQAPVEAAA